VSFKEWPRIALGWFLMLACLGFSAANAVILSRGAARWADSGWEKAMYGGIAGIVPFLIAIIPLVVWYSWRVKRRGWAIAASCVYVVFLAYNLIGAGGAIAMVRADAVSARKFDASRDRDRSTERTALAKQRNDIPAGTRPPDVLRGLIKGEQTKPLWGFSDGCRDLRNNQVRRFCAGYSKLQAELGAGKALEALTARIETLDKQAEVAGWVVQIADPASDTIAAALGLVGVPTDTDKVQRLLPLATPLMIELGSMVLGGLAFVVLGFGSHKEMVFGRTVTPSTPAMATGGQHPAPPVAPIALTALRSRQTQLADWFFSECTRPVSGGGLPEDQWYALYCEVCARSKDAPLDVEAFRSIAHTHGAAISEVDGKTYYSRVLPLIPQESAA